MAKTRPRRGRGCLRSARRAKLGFLGAVCRLGCKGPQGGWTPWAWFSRTASSTPRRRRSVGSFLSTTSIEKVHNLGPDWFGKNVRMGTVLLQARRGEPLVQGNASFAVVAGDLRQKAIRDEVPLTQIEESRKRAVPLSRSAASPTAEIEVFRGVKDDTIMDVMASRSVPLADVCDRARGEEFNKAGLLWECPGCLSPTTPGQKRKGGLRGQAMPELRPPPYRAVSQQGPFGRTAGCQHLQHGAVYRWR